jgi:ATP-dependent protease HslVU (ClpYQ) peptidase subunit
VTVLVGVVAGERVVIAADSVTTDETRSFVLAQKIAHHDDCLIACAGDAAALPVLQGHLRIKPPKVDQPVNSWAQRVAENATDILKARGIVEQDDGVEVACLDALLAHGGHLWVLNNNLALPITGRVAIGSGAMVALGALHALDVMAPHLLPEPRATTAVEAAIAVHLDIRGPVQVMTT